MQLTLSSNHTMLRTTLEGISSFLILVYRSRPVMRPRSASNIKDNFFKIVRPIH
jgi:hypothetical protein